MLRAKHITTTLPGAEFVVTGDLSDLNDTLLLAEKINRLGAFDAIIHNAGVYKASNNETFMVNSLAPYILTCLINKPRRLIYLSSGLHTEGDPYKDYSDYKSGNFYYADTKLHIVMLAKAVSRKWPDVFANAVNPGWVPTKMGGIWAPDNLNKGAETQAWLAVSNDSEALVSGKYFFHKQQRPSLPAADNITFQENYLEICYKICGLTL